MAFASITSLGNDSNRDNEDKLNNVISDTNSGIRSSLHLVNNSVDFVCFEILSRLPVKSLVRFKCACKHWQFLIEKDSHFIDLHQTRSKPSLLILAPKQIDESVYIRNPHYREFLITANLLFEGSSNNPVSVADVHTISETDRNVLDTLLGPINGLIGFFDITIYKGVCILNIGTREITPWIKSPVASGLEDPEYYTCVYRNGNCSMGFDPVTKEHKVICIWDISFNHSYQYFCKKIVCEVLTVGDNKWRRIVETPPCTCGKASVCVNGSIYYATSFMCRKIREDNNKIVVFDVGLEKFRTITVPNFIIEHPRDNDQFIRSSCVYEGVFYELLEVDDHIALFSRINGYIVKLWLLDGNVDCNNNDTSNQNWTEVTIELPYFWGADRSLSLRSIVGTSQIILLSLQISGDKLYNLSLHSYNWRDKIFKEFEISGVPSVVPSFSFKCYLTTFMESLLHVQKKETTTQQSAMSKQQKELQVRKESQYLSKSIS